jgi:TRAP-type C4-dicarboxylate transport system substrate-binding protein
MNDDLSSLSDAQRDALAARAIKTQQKAKARAEAYRERKKKAGMVQVSVWVPEDRADAIRRAFQKHVDKIMAESGKSE